MTVDPLERRPLYLELGCGSAKRDPNSVGIDLLPSSATDVVGDAVEILRSLPPASVDGIRSDHFLEHIDDVEGLLRLCAEVMKPGGIFVAIVPHFSNPYFYSDPTHKAFFGLYTLSYCIRATPFRRQVPQYIDPLPYILTRVRYHFKSSPPFYFRHGVKKTYGWLANLLMWTQEFYEENLCWTFPAYEIRYVLRRDDE